MGGLVLFWLALTVGISLSFVWFLFPSSCIPPVYFWEFDSLLVQYTAFYR